VNAAGSRQAFTHLSLNYLKRRLAADERKLMQMHHAVGAPKPFTLLVGGEHRLRIEYPRLSAFICG
jgi:hypothetical protein